MLFRTKFFTIMLAVIMLMLLSIGLVMIYSTTSETAESNYFNRQGIWIGVGLFMCATVMVVRLEWMSRYSHYFLLAIALVLTYLFLGRVIASIFSENVALKLPLLEGSTKGGFRWLSLKSMGLRFVKIQPSEFAKLALLIFLSTYYGTRDDNTIGSFWKGFFIPVVCCGYVLGMILAGKDLSSTVITAVMVFGIMFLAGVRLRYMLPLLLVAIALGVVMVKTTPYRMKRIQSYKEEFSAGKNADRYQLDHSEMALGGGGMFGRGFTKSLMKNNYLPESHTDFIVAVLGEELGFIGVVAVLGLYTFFLICLYFIAWGCHDKVGLLICLGVAILIPFQAAINIGVVSGFFPTTGLTAPFLSYGGSSMISTMMCMGLVFNVSFRNLTAITLERQQITVVPRKFDL